MSKTKQLINSDNTKHTSGNWDGLRNEPRNENLAKIRLGSFEKKENAREKEKEDRKAN